MQRALIQYRNPANYELVQEALTKAGRQDLIGFGPKCLIRPRIPNTNPHTKKKAEAKAYRKKTIRNVHKKKAK